MSTSITSGIEQVTPEVAESFLDTMKANRKLSTNRVTQLAQQMKEGLWIFDGSPIRFNDAGELVDGQHRMWAIIEAQHTAEFLIVRGVEKKAMATMDTGKSRSFSDVLGLNNPGLNDLGPIAAFTQLLYRWIDGRRGSALTTGRQGLGQSVPNGVMLDFFAENKERIVEVSGRSRTKPYSIRGISASVTALAIWEFEQIDAGDMSDFFTKLSTGAGLEPDSPILVLRNYVMRAMAGADKRAVIESDLALALVFKTWNAYREGQPMRALAYRRGGANPERFPEPK